MFEVRTQSKMDADWLARDEEIVQAAGRHSDFSGAGCGNGDPCMQKCGREHGWVVSSLEQATAMKLRLEAIPDVHATIREKISRNPEPIDA